MSGPDPCFPLPSPLPTLQAPAAVLGAWEAAELKRRVQEELRVSPVQGGHPWLQPTRVSAFLT